MKKLKSICALLAAAAATVLSGCGSSGSGNDLLDMSELIPVRETSKDNWGFYSPKGETFLLDEFEHRPSSVIGGLFSVQEGKEGYYTLYKFDEKKPAPVLEDLKAVGYLSEGLIPVVKKGERISIADKDGKVKFTLDPVKDKEITYCASGFSDGILAVSDQDNNYGYITTDGTYIAEPKYDSAQEFREGLAVVGVKEEGEEYKYQYSVIDTKGETVFKIKHDIYGTSFKDGLLLVKDDNERLIFLDTKGEQVYKCPEKMKGIADYNKKYIIFCDDEDNYGVSTFDGETVIRPKYDGMGFYGDDKFVVTIGDDDEKECKVIDKDGEELIDLDGYDSAFWAGRYGLVGRDKSGFEFLDDEGKPRKNAAFEEAEPSFSACWAVYSDYFNMDAAVAAVVGLIKDSGVAQYELGEAPSVHFTDPSNYTYTSSVTLDTLEIKGYKYDITVRANFNQSMADYTYESYGYYNYQRRDYWREGTVLASFAINISTETEWGNAGSIAVVKKLKENGFKLISQTDAKTKSYGALMTKGNMILMVTSNEGASTGAIEIVAYSSDVENAGRNYISNLNSSESDDVPAVIDDYEAADSVAVEAEPDYYY